MLVTSNYEPAGIISWGEGFLPGELVGLDGVVHYTNTPEGPVVDGHWRTKEEWEEFLDG